MEQKSLTPYLNSRYSRNSISFKLYKSVVFNQSDNFFQLETSGAIKLSIMHFSNDFNHLLISKTAPIVFLLY